MQYIQVICPNCKSSDITKTESGRYLCSYCRTEFTADFDEVDASMYHDDTNMHMQENQYQHEMDMQKLTFEQEMARKKFDLKINAIAPLISLAVIVFMGIAIILGAKNMITKHKANVERNKQESALRLEVNARDYLLDVNSLSSNDFSYLIYTAKSVANANKSSALNGDWVCMNDPEYVGSFLFTKYGKEYPSTKFAVILSEYWHSDRLQDSQVKYVAVVFDDIKLNSDGSINTNVSARQKQWQSNLGANGGMIIGLGTSQEVYNKLCSDYYDYNVTQHTDRTLNDLN